MTHRSDAEATLDARGDILADAFRGIASAVQRAAASTRDDFALAPPVDQSDALVTATRYTVSVLPADDINHRAYALYVELTHVGPIRRAVWVVHDGHGGYSSDGRWWPGISEGAEYQDVDDALALARRLAPNRVVNGVTATDAYRRTHAV